MDKIYEYKLVTSDGYACDALDTEKELNRLGEVGFRVISCTAMASRSLTWTLEREVKGSYAPYR